MSWTLPHRRSGRSRRSGLERPPAGPKRRRRVRAWPSTPGRRNLVVIPGLLVVLSMAPGTAQADDADLPKSQVAPVTEALTGLLGDTVRPEGVLEGVNISELWVRGVQDRDCPGQPSTAVVYTLSGNDSTSTFVRLGSFGTDAQGFGRFVHGQPAGKPIFVLVAGKNNSCQLTARAQVLTRAPITVPGCWKEACEKKYPSEQFCMSGAVLKSSNSVIKNRWKLEQFHSPSCGTVYTQVTRLPGAKNGLNALGVERNGEDKYRGTVLIPDDAVSVQTRLVWDGGPGTKFRARMFEGYNEVGGDVWHTP